MNNYQLRRIERSNDHYLGALVFGGLALGSAILGYESYGEFYYGAGVFGGIGLLEAIQGYIINRSLEDRLWNNI